MLIYGMGEKPLTDICRLMQKGIPFRNLTNIPQTAVLRAGDETVATNKKWRTIILHSHESCLSNKKHHAENFRYIEEESNSIEAARLIQPVDNRQVIVNPPYPPPTTRELDAVYALPFTRLPHPRYKGKEIPAYNMIRHSVTLHRGCFGGCAFAPSLPIKENSLFRALLNRYGKSWNKSSPCPTLKVPLPTWEAPRPICIT